ncbi:MAG: glycosyltransferase family 2 protein [Leptolyngbyaceae cyanobacterium RM2_2_4]|nr:glycosyltransferase family 2 protein [Leptolyngbyaceae cyanobacterium RM2_2_4]
MQMKQFLVSIVINNYNYGRYLGNAINSALGQTYSNTEVIVVDDGSTDQSREVISGYGDRIVAILKENGGQASALNAGFAASQGEIICFLDSDDVFLPNKASEVANIFQENPDIGWCFHPLILDEAEKLCDLGSKYSTASQQTKSEYSKIDFRVDIQNAKLPTFVPATSGLCFSRNTLSQIFPMPELKGVTISDLYIKYSAISLASGCALKEALAVQGVHSNNAYTRNKNRDELRSLFSRINTFTAYYMKKDFPFTSKLTNKLFAKGLATHLHSSKGGIQFNDIRDNYFVEASYLEVVSIWIKTFFYYVKLFKKELV